MYIIRKHIVYRLTVFIWFIKMMLQLIFLSIEIKGSTPLAIVTSSLVLTVFIQMHDLALLILQAMPHLFLLGETLRCLQMMRVKHLKKAALMIISDIQSIYIYPSLLSPKYIRLVHEAIHYCDIISYFLLSEGLDISFYGYLLLIEHDESNMTFLKWQF